MWLIMNEPEGVCGSYLERYGTDVRVKAER